MKLTVYLFLVSLFQIQASTYSQNTRITLNLKKVSVENVLKAIENKTEFKVLYNDRQVDYERVVSVNYKKAKVSEILKDLFAKTKINYEVLDKQIVLILDSNKRLLAEVEQQKTITGTVLDDGGMPLPGASVIVKGTNSGTTTDFDGNFSINVKGNNAVLLVSYVGFETKTVSVGSKSSITVSLNASAATLDEVVVVGYGSTKKSDLTGSVSVVKTKDIQKIAVTRVDDVLQGRTGGVQISKSSGAPGGNVNIRIRGTNSITGSNQPLVVIDDFIGGDLSTVDVNDVASIQVLKDASATAIYGSRASNGVIIVTTKKGSAGVQEVSFNTFVTAGKVLRKFDLMGAGQYAEQVNAQFEVFGKKLAFTQQEIDDFKEDGGTDWQDEIFRTGITTNYGLSLKGGSEKARYFVSGGYQDTQGIVINSFNKRYTARINTDFDISKNVTVGTNLFIVKEDELNVSNQGADGPNGSILQAVSYAPTIPVWDDAEGDYSQPNAIYGVISDNPVYRLKERNNRGRRNKLNLSAYLKWDLTENLSFRTSAVSNSQVYNVSVFNRFAPGGGIQDSQANHGNSYLNSFQNSNVLNYKNTFGDHSINASLIFETFQTETRRNNINATALKSIALGEYSTSFGEAISGASSLTASQLESYVGRVNYNFKEKYLLTATLRVDGSSKFAKGNRYGTFPSAAFGWKISEESFIKDIDVIDNLKFRASWGATGNQGINPYETLSTLGVGSNLPYQGGATSVSVGVAPNRIANNDLKWETTYQTNLGIDFGLFNSKLYGSVDWYKKTTEDLLLDVQLASSNGIPSQLKNIGEIENKGIELELGGIAIDNNDFRWTVSGNIAFNRNKVVSLIDSDNDSEILFTNNYFGNRVQGGAPNVLAEGHPIGMLWGLTYLGPWQIGQEAEAAEYGRVPGDAHFADPDGNKKYDDFGIIGDPNPDFTWGMSHKFTYKNLDLNMLLTGVQGKDVWNFVRWQTVSEFGGIRNPTNKDFINRWSPTNQGATLPGISATNEFRPQNTEFVEDGSYIKLKDVTLGYTHKADNYEGRIYISGQNLLMITDYRGLDPEADGQGSSNSGAQGGDTGAYPNSKSFTIGLNIKF